MITFLFLLLLLPVVVVKRARDELAIVCELEDEFDLVLIEIDLPDLDGLEFIESIVRLCKLRVVG